MCSFKLEFLYWVSLQIPHVTIFVMYWFYFIRFDKFFKINKFFHLLPFQLGIVIRALAAGHIPPTTFILVTMGSTSVLLIGWRTLLYSIFPNDQRKKNDVYKRGSPFELFEVLLHNLCMRKIIFATIKS